ncbi:glycosyltransferase family 2 protein [Membranihabitans maritimus]|uniref:glycosyltransferase family 2 protein n=1 Tax=Membranihabitans maritimus TaxID=2904244 RepID=UPI001F368716|nr:glycosyltransferase family 2 protein [Membranihabitans maritimus]
MSKSHIDWEYDLSVVVPLLNEEESLAELERWIHSVAVTEGYEYEIIFVDDGSTDRSWEVIKELIEKNANVKGIRFRRNYGKSAALNTAFDVSKGRVVVTMDADLQDNPEEIPEMYNMIVEDGFDLVSGWKKKRYDNKWTKNLPSKLFNWAARKMSGIFLHDFNCGLKAYRKNVVHSIEVYGEMHRYIPIIAKWGGFQKIGEKVVQHQQRKYGKSKFGMSRFVNGFLDLLSIFFMGKFGKRPMHFFGLLGTCIIFVGVLSALYIGISKWISIQKGIPAPLVANNPFFFISLVSIILGTQLFLAGFLGELITRNASERNTYQLEELAGFGSVESGSTLETLGNTGKMLIPKRK